jgi:hypothetical protein
MLWDGGVLIIFNTWKINLFDFLNNFLYRNFLQQTHNERNIIYHLPPNAVRLIRFSMYQTISLFLKKSCLWNRDDSVPTRSPCLWTALLSRKDIYILFELPESQVIIKLADSVLRGYMGPFLEGVISRFQDSVL